jgi:oligoendopeptidase F
MQAMNAPASLPVWSLADLYESPTDPRIAADLDAAAGLAGELAAREGLFLEARADPARLAGLIAAALQLYERITNLLGGVGAYASMAASVDRADPVLAKLEADVRGRSAEIGAQTLFLTLELNQLEDAEIEAALAADPAAARWRPFLRRVRLSRPHELTPDLEHLFVERGPVAAQWGRLFDETLARLKVEAGRETLTLNDALHRLSDPKPARRKEAAEGLAAALSEATPVLGLALNAIGQEKLIEDRWRRFATPAASRHLANEVDADAVEAMVAAVVERYPTLSHRYYRLKAKAMGRDRLDYWDRNAPVERTPPRAYDWPQAQALTLQSFADLGPRFADTAEAIFAKPWIDARPRPGKRSGAYAHPVTADRHPYVFLNFMGERRDVLTLAHEMGHAIHQMLARPQGTLLADTPLTLAETASIFAEGLVFERLLAEAEPDARRGLVAGRIEDGLNTVVRQIAFHRFETRLHDARAKGELSAGEIGGIWTEAMGESLGPAITLNPGYEHYWAYISHFAHTPFYVYAYAFGDLLVAALMERRRLDPAGFAPLYEALLAAGGTRTYVEALAPFGLNPRDKAFWATGLDRLERLVEEFEALACGGWSPALPPPGGDRLRSSQRGARDGPCRSALRIHPGERRAPLDPLRGPLPPEGGEL